MTIDPNAAPTAMQPDGLVKRLNAKYLHVSDHAGEDWRLINPNGPEAAAHITRREEDVARLTKERDKWEARFWKMDANFDRAVTRAETAEAQNKAMREAGSQLANCAYNLSQPSQAMRLEERTRATLKECCEAWDRATLSSIKEPK